MKKRLLVGIILSEMHHQFFSNASKKLQEELLKMDADVCVFTTTALSDMPEEYLSGDSSIYDLITPELFDGFIVYPGTFQMPEQQERFLKKLKDEYHKPVYCLERPKLGFPTVPFLEEEGIAMLVDHLVKVHKAETIEYISSEIDDDGFRKELEGYFLNAIRKEGIPVTVHSIHYGKTNVGNEAKIVEEMLMQEGGLPQAIICGNTESVSGFICAFEEKGIHVPRDIMICGYNLDIDETLRGTTCTTIFRDPSRMAVDAARKLINDILGEEKYPPVSRGQECVLVPKATCGCEFYALGDYSHIRMDRLLTKDRLYESPFNFMQEEIASAEDFESWLWLLDYYERYLGKECAAFYLCLNENALHQTTKFTGFTDNILLALNHSKVRKVSATDFFPKSALLPALSEPCDHPRVFYFAALHFMDRVFGYAVVCYGNRACGLTASFDKWMRSLETSLECQRQKTVFRDYYTENATRDMMTGLYNFKGYLNAVKEQFAQLAGKERVFRILSLDISRFSSINELFGREEGNEALLTLTKILLNSINDRDVCARFGNDEFVVAGVYDREPDVKDMIREIKNRLKTINQFGGKQYTIDIVYTTLTQKITKEEQIEEFTNDVLAQKKNLKQGSFSDSSEAVYELDPEECEAVRTLIEENGFAYLFQPIVDAKNGSIYAYEALMRSGSDEKIPPLSILRYAETLGRLYDIEKLTFWNVAEIMMRNSNVFTDRKMFLNSIPKVTLKDKDFKDFTLQYPGVLPNIVIEFTEQTELSEEQLDAIRKRSGVHGFRVAIDDYGTGYSNVTNLLNYMPDYVKIDRNLIAGIEADSKKQYFVANIVEFARENGFLALAEGVETKEEMDAVIRLGVDLIQGFYTARPSDGFQEEIARDIRDEIISLNIQAGESRTKKTYIVDKEQEIMLMPLVTTEHYTEFVINRRELSIVGNPRISVDVLIRIPDNTTTTIHLRRVSLDSYQRHPCIEIGNNCDVTIVIEGTAVLNRKGIRVPESSRLTLTGDGKLTVYGTGDRAYGIGGDSTQTIGRITIDMSGDITLKLDGKECVGIGGGYSNRKAGIYIDRCKNLYTLASGERAVGVGICNNIAPISLKETRLKMEINADRAVAVGSLTAECDITLSGVKLNYTSSGDSQVTVGTLSNRPVKIVARHFEMQTTIKAKTCVGIGCRDGSADIRLDSSEIDLRLEGAEAVGIGSKTKEGRGQFEKTVFRTIINSADRIDFGYEPENMSFLMCKV
ncbi:MAG: EAL domain-containing protein [Lachnospiraceae bacterium]|nr:EAL domain-containing protein [Lachnospiraceae bacterium]